MTAIANHMRMTGLQVTNEDVDTRKSAVTDLVAAWAKLTDTNVIILKAAEIAQALGGNGTPPATLGGEIESTVQTYASAFLQSERPLEVGIVAGCAAIELMSTAPGSSGWTVADILGTALWLALSFQPALEDAKREALRASVLQVAESRSSNGAEASRQRSPVNDFGDFAIVAGAEAEVPAAFKKATLTTIEALRRNAALDREELDFLWWSQLSRSRLLNRPLSSIDEPVRVVAAGIEAAAHLRRLPCEVHRDLVLRTAHANLELDQAGLLAAIGDDRAALGKPYTDGLVSRAPRVFPLLHALASGATSVDGAAVKRTAAEWGARALLEAGLVKIHATGPAKL
jgi:GTPase-associated system helical domain